MSVSFGISAATPEQLLPFSAKMVQRINAVEFPGDMLESAAGFQKLSQLSKSGILLFGRDFISPEISALIPEENCKLRSELEYLKYQVNPQFFMNSLNNIHALIDINKNKAQAAVQELSGMMRYLLYDKASMFVPLEKEISFLKNYIELMRLRYTDKLELSTDFSTEPQGVFVPSLLFTQFVENAFKHGVTYKKKSLIYVSLDLDEAGEYVLFVCRNTLHDAAKATTLPSQGGIGIENARKRLELLYGGKASMRIDNDGEWYNVELKIPTQYDKVYNS